MKITIAQLYPNELCLYGENGNIKALKYALEKRNINVEIVNITKEDKLELNKYDFLYIGSGREKYLKEVKERLTPYKEDFLNYIKQDKPFLITGNAVSIFDFLGLYEVEEFNDYKVADVLATTSLCNGKIKGFQNTLCLIKSTNHLLFNMENGYGNNNTLMEGYNNNHLYATTIIGPILARNDNLLEYFISLLIDENTD